MAKGKKTHPNKGPSILTPAVINFEWGRGRQKAFIMSKKA
jgi:hypothetical protein